MSASLDKIKIAVIGDSGVGKTSLVHILSHGETLKKSPWTIGCSVEVLLYDFKHASSGADKSVFIEFWDVGGSTSHQNSRSIFYNSVNGVILVHDLSNKKSYQNLRKWFSEVLYSGKQDFTGVTVKNGLYDSLGAPGYENDEFSGNTLPVIIVGTKLDQAPQSRLNSGYVNLAGEIGALQVNLDCLQKKSLSLGSQNWETFTKFLDKAIERKFVKSQTYNQQKFDCRQAKKNVLNLFINKTRTI
eukprot:gene143-755_t